jgi:hypothetical protein
MTVGKRVSEFVSLLTTWSGRTKLDETFSHLTKLESTRISQKIHGSEPCAVLQLLITMTGYCDRRYLL